MLNPDQKNCYDYLIQETHGCFLIEGFAGTGKTFVAKELIKNFLNSGKDVLGIAPTHQAKLQLQDTFLEFEHNKQLNFSTAAAFLKVERKTDGVSGEEIYTDPTFDFTFVTQNTVIIIDETSMFTKKYLDILFEYGKTCLVIFLGDFNQLPPINESSHRKMFNNYGIFNLTIQQRNSGDILQLCNSLRNSTKLPNENSDNIEILQDRKKFTEDLIEHIKNNNDPFGISYLAYTNNAVNYMRNKIHYALYNNYDYNVGQYVRLEKPCSFGFIGEIFVITNVRKVKIELFYELEFDGYSVDMCNVLNGKTGNVNVLNFNNQDDVIECAKEMYKENRINHALYDKETNKTEKEKLWKLWNDGKDKVKTLENVMFLSSPYSTTVHKSQGRTIRYVYVDAGNILKYKNDITKNLLYVAVSRAKEKLILKK